MYPEELAAVSNWKAVLAFSAYFAFRAYADACIGILEKVSVYDPEPPGAKPSSTYRSETALTTSCRLSHVPPLQAAYVPAVGAPSEPKERVNAPLYCPISTFENTSVRSNVPPEDAE